MLFRSDCIVDIGPGAGEHGGQIVAVGTAEEIMKNPESITGAYLSGRLQYFPDNLDGTMSKSVYFILLKLIYRSYN